MAAPELPAALPQLACSLPGGDQLHVALHGAHVLRWHSAGRERIYLSPNSLFDGKSAIRGGVPLCFPQFNQRVLGEHSLPKHGFARNLPWRVVQQASDQAQASVCFELVDVVATRALWPHAFVLRLTLRLRPSQLRMEIDVHNPGAQPWPFALALHSYLAVDDIAQTQLHGLQGQSYWDSVADPAAMDKLRTQTDAALRFDAETDRVYAAAAEPLRLNDELRITQSDNFTDTVVWNPGADLCARLADMPDDGYRHMLCVEAARINQPVSLAPGQTWSGWQQFDVL